MNDYVELVVDYLNTEFYYSAVDNCVFSISSENYKIGYQQMEDIITKVFDINEDVAHAILFNWLLANGVKLVRKNWNRRYMVHNSGVIEDPIANATITADIDFEYKLITDDI